MPEEGIVEANVQKMLSKAEGGMAYAVCMESCGGNAGHVQGHACAGVGFIFGKDDGRIKYFHYEGEKIPYDPETDVGLMMRVALESYYSDMRLLVVECDLRDAGDDARRIIERSINRFNYIHGFKL